MFHHNSRASRKWSTCSLKRPAPSCACTACRKRGIGGSRGTSSTLFLFFSRHQWLIRTSRYVFKNRCSSKIDRCTYAYDCLRAYECAMRGWCYVPDIIVWYGMEFFEYALDFLDSFFRTFNVFQHPPFRCCVFNVKGVAIATSKLAAFIYYVHTWINKQNPSG